MKYVKYNVCNIPPKIYIHTEQLTAGPYSYFCYKIGLRILLPNNSVLNCKCTMPDCVNYIFLDFEIWKLKT